MRIISPFHDYYDSAMGYGQDPNLIYKRTPGVSELFYKDLGSPLQQIIEQFPNMEDEVQWYPLFACIGFCGKAYPVVLVEGQQIDMDSVSGKLLFGFLSCKQYVEIDVERTGVTDWDRERHMKTAAKDYQAFCEDLKGFSLGTDLHLKLDSPVFIALLRSSRSRAPTTLLTNPRLANFGFASKVEPFTAFQEIAMFLGSQLAKEDQAPRNVGGDKNHR